MVFCVCPQGVLRMPIKCFAYARKVARRALRPCQAGSRPRLTAFRTSARALQTLNNHLYAYSYIVDSIFAKMWRPSVSTFFVYCFRKAVFADKRRNTFFLTIAQKLYSVVAKNPL